jgi:hypothetical protein
MRALCSMGRASAASSAASAATASVDRAAGARVACLTPGGRQTMNAKGPLLLEPRWLMVLALSKMAS